MNEPEAIEAESRQLAVRGELVDERQPAPSLALFSGEPDEVVLRAVKVADALKKVVEAKGLIKKIQGRDFVEVAGWQTLGAMVGVTAYCEWSRQIDNGWEARVVVRRNGADIGAAEAQCTRSERTWSSRDDYALRSMAQTRATSKALRSVLGFIVVLAGYADTPAEEMPGYAGGGAPTSPAPKGVPLDEALKRADAKVATISADKDAKLAADAEVERAKRDRVFDAITDSCGRHKITADELNTICLVATEKICNVEYLTMPELRRLRAVLKAFVESKRPHAQLQDWLDEWRIANAELEEQPI